MLSRLLLILLLVPRVVMAREVPLRLGTFEVAPYGAFDRNGQPAGVFFHLTDEIAARAALPYVNELYPPARLYALLQRRQIDLTISSRVLDRDLGLVNLGRIGDLEGLIIYRADLPLAPRILADFAPYIIGRLGGTCPSLARAHMHLYDLGDYAQGYRMLLAGRLDAICGDRGGLTSALGAMSAHQANAIRSFAFLHTGVWVYANPEMPESTQARIRQVVRSMVSGGEVDKLMRLELPTFPGERGQAP